MWDGSSLRRPAFRRIRTEHVEVKRIHWMHGGMVWGLELSDDLWIVCFARVRVNIFRDDL